MRTLRSQHSPSLSHFLQNLAVCICLGRLSQAITFLRKLAILFFHVKLTRPSRGLFLTHAHYDVGTKIWVLGSMSDCNDNLNQTDAKPVGLSQRSS